jgi:hypothetical protein
MSSEINAQGRLVISIDDDANVDWLGSLRLQNLGTPEALAELKRREETVIPFGEDPNEDEAL